MGKTKGVWAVELDLIKSSGRFGKLKNIVCHCNHDKILQYLKFATNPNTIATNPIATESMPEGAYRSCRACRGRLRHDHLGEMERDVLIG